MNRNCWLIDDVLFSFKSSLRRSYGFSIDYAEKKHPALDVDIVMVSDGFVTLNHACKWSCLFETMIKVRAWFFMPLGFREETYYDATFAHRINDEIYFVISPIEARYLCFLFESSSLNMSLVNHFSFHRQMRGADDSRIVLKAIRSLSASSDY